MIHPERMFIVCLPAVMKNGSLLPSESRKVVSHAEKSGETKEWHSIPTSHRYVNSFRDLSAGHDWSLCIAPLRGQQSVNHIIFNLPSSVSMVSYQTCIILRRCYCVGGFFCFVLLFGYSFFIRSLGSWRLLAFTSPKNNHAQNLFRSAATCISQKPP